MTALFQLAHIYNIGLLFQGNRYEQEKLLKQSHTLYVGNLSFYTTEEQVGFTFVSSKHIISKSPKLASLTVGLILIQFSCDKETQNVSPGN